MVVKVSAPAELIEAVQVVRGQRRVQLIEGRHLATAGAKGDAGRGATVGRGDRQRLASERGRSAGGAGRGARSQAKLGKARTAGDGQIAGRAGVQRDRAGGEASNRAAR